MLSRERLDCERLASLGPPGGRSRQGENTPADLTLLVSPSVIRIEAAPDRLIGDRAYDSDGLDQRLMEERGIELIAPHRSNRKRAKTQDGRPLRRMRDRWRVERLFAWLQNYRRLVTRYERHAENFLGFVDLGCICILLRHL